MDRSLVAKATSSDNSPTPGYMYDEIAKMTLSSYEGNRQVANYVVTRLKNKNHNVKWKCLVIIKHVALKGSPSFRRDMMRDLPVIKECLQFTGPPDPLRGDEIYKRVREEAKEALEIITTSDISAGPSGTDTPRRMEGIGSEPWDPNAPQEPTTRLGQVKATLGGAAAVAGTAMKNAALKIGGGEPSYSGGSFNEGGRRMEGLGNPNMEDPRGNRTLGNSLSKGVRNFAFNRDTGLRDDLSRTYASNRGMNPYPGASGGGYDSQALGQTYSDAAPANTGYQDAYDAAKNQAAFQWSSNSSRSTGAPGGVWGQPTGTSANGSRGGGGSGGSSSEGVGAEALSAGAPTGPPRAGNAAQDGEYERNMIAELCAPGGTRAQPPKDKLEHFISKAASLDPDLVGPCLLDHIIAEGAWQVKSKVLCVIEAIATAPGCEEHVAYLLENAADIQDLVGKKPASVSTKAVKVLRMLGFEEIDAPGEPTPVTEHGGVILEAEAAEPLQDVGAAVPAVAEEPVDLLGDYSDPAPAPSVQTPGPVEAVPETVPAASSGSMFGNLAMKTTPPPAAESTPMEAASGDLLGAIPSQQNGSQTVSVELGGLVPEPANMLLPPDNDQEAPVNATVDHFANMDLMGETDPGAMAAPTAQTTMPPPMEAMPAAMPGAMLAPMPGAMPAPMPGAMPAPMPGVMPAPMQGGMPGAMPGAMSGAMPGADPVAAMQYQNMMLMQQMQRNQMQLQQMMAGSSAQSPAVNYTPVQSSMISASAPRKVIPGQEAAAGGDASGFSFLSESDKTRASSASSTEDAFDFVKGAMKATK